MTMTAQGTMVAKTSADRGALFMTGEGESPTGAQPFLDRLDIATGKATRLWRSQGEQYEEPIAMLDDRGSRVLTRRQTHHRTAELLGARPGRAASHRASSRGSPIRRRSSPASRRSS